MGGNVTAVQQTTKDRQEGKPMSPVALELEQVARNYCELIEASSPTEADWLSRVASLLPRLHAAVAALGEPPLNGEHAMTADLDARFELYTHLRELLGELDGYWMEFDSAEDRQCMSGSLADDLTDIYCELKHGLGLLAGRPDEALDGWRRGFKVHWGQHLVDAERHLYDLRAKGELR
jgi:hypothetical protein